MVWGDAVNFASLEHCKELYELSGWKDTDIWFGNGDVSNVKRNSYGVYFDNNDIPAYDLGFLLRKLRPIFLSQDDTELAEALRLMCQVPSPEDSLCKLAIELFKQGLLTKAVA